jgi:uncharacterized protein YjbI with pentapeptide repeats
MWLASSRMVRADIVRWDNGHVIPGTEGITPGPRVQLNNRQLEYASLSFIDLTGASFFGSNLTNASLDFSTATDANLAGATVIGANFSYTTSRGFTKEQLYSTASYQQKNLRGIVLGCWATCGLGIPPLDDLTGWDLSGQDLANASFGSVTLTNANLAAANLTNATLHGSTLSNTDLTGAIVTRAGFSRTTSRGFTKKQLYSTASYQQKNLNGINLAGNDLSGWDLSGQNLTDTRLYDSTLIDAILTAADLRGTEGANLTGAIIRNAIRPDGSVEGLELAGGDQLVVRDGNAIPIRVQDRMAMSNGGVLRLIFEDDPWNSLICFQPGIPVQLGGTLELVFTLGAHPHTQIGRSIRIFDWSGVTPDGTFGVESPYTWDLSRLYTTGEVTLLAVPEPLAIVILLCGASFLHLSGWLGRHARKCRLIEEEWNKLN